MKFNEKKNNNPAINERLKDVLLITCVLSNEDSPAAVFEDIAALSALSPNCRVRIVGNSEIDGVYDSVGNLKEFVLVPSKEEKAELKQLFSIHKKEEIDILYCRNAETSPIERKYIEGINARLAIMIGNPQKKLKLKGQVLRIEDESAMLKSVMSFIPDTKIKWSLSAEILRIAKTFLKDRSIKKDYFCIDVSLEENFYEFFRNYGNNNVSFLFVGNSSACFSNENGKVIYSGDISREYLSALVSLSRGCLVYEDNALLAEAKQFEKPVLKLDINTMSVDLIKKFIDKNN